MEKMRVTSDARNVNKATEPANEPIPRPVAVLRGADWATAQGPAPISLKRGPCAFVKKFSMLKCSMMLR